MSGARPPVVRLATLFADRTLALWDIAGMFKIYYIFQSIFQSIFSVNVSLN